MANRTAATPGLLAEVRRRAAEGPSRFTLLVPRTYPVRAVTTAVREGNYDELILSTLPSHVSRWLHTDLPTRLQRFGLPLTVVTAQALDRQLGG
jgi:hypothetical protein